MTTLLRIVQASVGAALIALVLWDAFESIVLPRTVTRFFRLTRFFYRSTWAPWAALGRRISAAQSRERFLSLFGPLSLLVLLAFWAAGLMAGFGLMYSGVEPGRPSFSKLTDDFYLSGTTFFTLGLGDVKPDTSLARTAVIFEAGIGFGFLALVISYLPVVYAAFSRREVMISRLDVRAGAPPTAGEWLRQRGETINPEVFDTLMRDAEIWCAELLEAHLSYPVLCLYRSQHRDQSWLATLTVILDAGALILVGLGDVSPNQSAATFAMGRRAAVDLAHLFLFPERAPDRLPTCKDRLPSSELNRLRSMLDEAGTQLAEGQEATKKLSQLRATYEPALSALSDYLLMPLPPFLRPPGSTDRPATASEQLTNEEGGTDVSIV